METDLGGMKTRQYIRVALAGFEGAVWRYRTDDPEAMAVIGMMHERAKKDPTYRLEPVEDRDGRRRSVDIRHHALYGRS